MGFRHRLRELLWKYGYDVCAFEPGTHPLAREREIFRSYAIDVVFDVGANTGQFASHIRHDIGFKGKIISFEPLGSAFETLKRNASGDNLWHVYNFGLGDSGTKTRIHVAANSVSSSLLTMLPSHLKAAPGSQFVKTEEVQIKTLDSILSTLCSKDDSIYLKLDTQGFESKVLRGARKSLSWIDTIQLEMSLVPLYESEWPFDRMYKFLVAKGYDLVSIVPVYFGSIPGQILQVDGVFRRL
jgi:FkbM family methyltransferase